MDQNTRIFGIGLSRTGTLSLTAALTKLGISAKHFPEDETTQHELRTGNYNLSVLKETQALTDIPVAPYYAQFDRQFPDAKFILTTRPTDAWLASMETHFRFWVDHNRDDFTDFTLACTYGVLHFSPERMRYVKEMHESSVRSYFADRPEKLLVFNASDGDGWEELCGFLGCPIPDEPYPHANQKLSAPARPSQPGEPPTTWVRKLVRRWKQ